MADGEAAAKEDEPALTEQPHTEVPEGYHFAVPVAELKTLGRKTVSVQGRTVAVFLVKSQVYCLDHFCYRKL